MLNKKTREKFFIYAKDMLIGNWPLERFLVESYITEKIDEKHLNDSYSFEQIVQGKISKKNIKKLEEILDPKGLMDLQLMHLEESRNVLHEIKPYIDPKIIVKFNNSDTARHYDWLKYCTEMHDKLEKKLRAIYLLPTLDMIKIRNVHYFVEEFYKEGGRDRKMIEEIARQVLHCVIWKSKT